MGSREDNDNHDEAQDFTAFVLSRHKNRELDEMFVHSL